MRRKLCFAAALVLLAGSLSPLGAQFAQYTPPGSLAAEEVKFQERLETAMEEARWHLGPLRVDPWFGLREVAYVDDGGFSSSEDRPADYTATAGAGLRTYLPVGPKAIWATHLLPEYVWWRERTADRRWNGRYGTGLFVFLNRLQLMGALTREEVQGAATAESERRVTSRANRASLDLDLRLGGAISLFASAALLEARYLKPEDEDLAFAFANLDRDEEVWRAGVRYRFPRSVALGLGVEGSTVEFPSSARDRSNDGTSYVAILTWEGAYLQASVEAVERSLEPRDARSEFVPFEETTGSFKVALRPGSRTTLRLYGGRNLVYSLDEASSYFVEDLLGGGVAFELGWRTRLTVFAEQGQQDYRALGSGATQRTDDRATVGGELSFQLRKQVLLVLGASRTEYDSDQTGFDRETSQLRVGLALGGGFGPWF